MAEEEVIEEVEDAGAAPSGGGGGGGKMKIIIIALLVLIIAGGAAAYFLLLKGDGTEGAKPADEVAVEDTAQNDSSLGVTHELDPFIVNLAGDANRYLKVVVVLQLSTEGVAEEIKNRGPQIKDSVITVLSSKTPEEILTVQGKYDLKMELIKRVNAIVSTGVVRDLFFTEFVVQ